MVSDSGWPWGGGNNNLKSMRGAPGVCHRFCVCVVATKVVFSCEKISSLYIFLHIVFFNKHLKK